MWPSSLLSRPLDLPVQALITVFVAWKVVLLLVAAGSPGPGYDTSTIPYHSDSNGTTSHSSNHVAKSLSFICNKLTRWDAVYFTTIANRGYVYEQEWAFGWGFTRLIAFFAKDLREIGLDNYDFLESFIGITISHASHGLSVFALYSLARSIFPGPSTHKLAFVAACLHIFSSAGLFLSAPYGESSFALLSFLGSLLFAKSFGITGQVTFVQDVLLALSGILFGLATTMRNNGLLNGLIFLEEALRVTYSLKDGIKLTTIRRGIAAGIGGLSIGIGFLIPQYLAYQEFCGLPAIDGGPPRIWCQKTIPSVYSFVQDHYWNVGFLRYYTLLNTPLFVLASPMLAIMTLSCFWTVDVKPVTNDQLEGRLNGNATKLRKDLGEQAIAMTARTNRLLHSLAVPQFLLAILALTSYHVQIITRICSGYPVWYLWTASIMVEVKSPDPTSKSKEEAKNQSWHLERFAGAPVLKYLIVYALVQGGLFSSFLPPA